MAQHHFDNRKFLLTINENHANGYLFIFHRDVLVTSRKYVSVDVAKVYRAAKHASATVVFSIKI